MFLKQERSGLFCSQGGNNNDRVASERGSRASGSTVMDAHGFSCEESKSCSPTRCVCPFPSNFWRSILSPQARRKSTTTMDVLVGEGGSARPLCILFSHDRWQRFGDNATEPPRCPVPFQRGRPLRSHGSESLERRTKACSASFFFWVAHIHPPAWRAWSSRVCCVLERFVASVAVVALGKGLSSCADVKHPRSSTKGPLRQVGQESGLVQS